MSAFIDLTGRRFGRLLVMQATSKRSSQGDIYWKCVCDCGKSVVVNGKSLRSSGQKSCGCLQREWADSQHNRRTHDGSKDRLFRVWRGMIDRCYYPSHNRYPDYGGRGIYICSEWRHDYAAFREWAMKNGYDANAPRGACTIDRMRWRADRSPKPERQRSIFTWKVMQTSCLRLSEKRDSSTRNLLGNRYLVRRWSVE